MMNKKRVLAALLAGVMAVLPVSCASGNGGNSGSTESQSESQSQSSGEVLHYTMFRNASYIQGYAEDGGEGKQVILDKLAEAGITNVDFTVTIGGGDEYFTKLNALAASDSLPDYFNVDSLTMTKYADQGLIIELDNLMKENAPALTSMQRESDINAIKYNGKLYAVPPAYRPEEFNGPTTSGMVYRKDWLDALGLSAPTTIEELHQVLKAFTENDPDGNGQNDTFGMAASASGRTVPAFDCIFAAYDCIPTFWYEEDDGRLVLGANKPEAKTVLELLHSWYEEGLIDTDYPVAQSAQVEEKFINGKAGMAFLSALDVNTQTPVPTALRAANPDAVMAMLIPPEGPNSHKGYAESEPGYGDLRAISSKTKHPEILMQMINWSVDDSETGGFWLVTYGEEGVDYTYDEEANRVTMLSDYNTLYKKGYSNPVRFAQLVDRRWMEDDSSYEALEITNGNAVSNKFWSSVPAMQEYPDTMELWLEYSTKIITGQLPLEAYDEYLEKFYSQGGTTIEEQVNESYQTMS